jgi:hypothetical protein
MNKGLTFKIGQTHMQRTWRSCWRRLRKAKLICVMTPDRYGSGTRWEGHDRPRNHAEKNNRDRETSASASRTRRDLPTSRQRAIRLPLYRSDRTRDSPARCPQARLQRSISDGSSTWCRRACWDPRCGIGAALDVAGRGYGRGDRRSAAASIKRRPLESALLILRSAALNFSRISIVRK